MNRKGLVFSVICLFLYVLACTPNRPAPPIRIATSANMQYAMKALVQKFTQQTGIACEVIIGSSGKLTAQIKQGAPFDLLVAADNAYPLEIQNTGFAANAPVTYAYGKLVVWTTDERITPTMEALRSAEVQHIAIPNPKLAPYGKAALEVLENTEILTHVEEKLVFGESIAQTNQFIVSGAATLGFTSKSVVMAPDLQYSGKWVELNADYYSPIEQSVVVIKSSRARETQAKKLQDFLFSASAKKILENFGYSVAD